MSGYIKTMRDLEAATYGVGGGSGNTLLKAGGVVGGFGGNYDGIGHDVTSAAFSGAEGLNDLYGVLYGQKVWSMLNREVNAFAMLSKRPYTSSGWRILKSRPAGGSGAKITTGTEALDSSFTSANAAAIRPDHIGGVGENAALESDGFRPLAPEYTKLFMSPKTVAHMFEFTELGLEMAQMDDGVGDVRAIVREDMAKHHAEMQNKMLLMPLEDYDINGIDGMEKNYTSLMKVVSSSAELAAMANAGGMIHLDKDTNSSATDTTINSKLSLLYGSHDRTGDSTQTQSGNLFLQSGNDGGYAATPSFMDAVVNFGDGYGATQGRTLTLSLLNTVIRDLRLNGGNPKVMLTGYDTIQHISDLLQSQERFMDTAEIVPTHGGVKGVKGSEVGFRVASYYGIPLIPCKDMPQTGQSAANKLSDILMLDTDHLWLAMVKPTQYFEDGIDSGNPFGVKKLGNQAMYRTIGETGCSFFKGQGKITNITSA